MQIAMPQANKLPVSNGGYLVLIAKQLCKESPTMQDRCSLAFVWIVIVFWVRKFSILKNIFEQIPQQDEIIIIKKVLLHICLKFLLSIMIFFVP